MKKKKLFFAAAGLLLAFVLWTATVSVIDVQAVGPQGSHVGFATLNQFVHRLTGVHMGLYVLTDWLGLVPIGTAAGFALFGLVQWLRRKSLRKVDADILALGGFYIGVMAAYVLFEFLVINYRPVLIEGALEVSYPSSTTVLVMTIMLTAAMQMKRRMNSVRCRRLVTMLCAVFVVFMVVGRTVSGVHWFTDIVGGILLSAGLVLGYRAAIEY